MPFNSEFDAWAATGYKALLSYARKIAGDLEPEDLVQEVMIVIQQEISKGTQIEDLGGYGARVLLFKSLNHRRRNERRKRLGALDISTETAMFWPALLSAFELLDDETFELLTERVIEGRSVEEIARTRQMSTYHVRKSVHRALSIIMEEAFGSRGS